MPASDKSLAKTLRMLGALSTVGLSFVLAVVIGTWVGWLLDGWLGTTPWLFMTFFFVGLAAGVLTRVNAEVGLASSLVRAVAREAILGQNRPDVGVEIDDDLGRSLEPVAGCKRIRGKESRDPSLVSHTA